MKKETISGNRLRKMFESNNPPKSCAEACRRLATRLLFDEELQDYYVELFRKDPDFENDSKEVILSYIMFTQLAWPYAGSLVTRAKFRVRVEKNGEDP